MLFLHPWLLWGLLGISIPVLIHLFNRRNAKKVEWGAVRFLLDSLMSRQRSLLLEELLLMAVRSLLCGCAVLAMVRPFIPAGSTFPWWLILPLGMFGIVLFGITFVLDRYRGWQFVTAALAILCLAACGVSIFFEERLSSSGFASGSERDIAVVIDGSSSMTLNYDGEMNFKRALNEAKQLIEKIPRGAAFSVIVAGAVPDPLVPAPVTDRKYVLDALERAIPVHGVLQVPDALAAAAAALVDGQHVAKQIVLISDGQSIGWQTDDLERWQSLASAFDKLPSRPRVFVRNLNLPQGIRNLTVKDVSFSRPVVGTDRDVRIDITIANTGLEAATPSKISLDVGASEELVNSAVGQMAPGSESIVSFRHRFKKRGARVVTAQVDADDEMAADDTMRRVIQIVGVLKVLVVDDGRAIKLLDRAGGFVALGLMPSLEGLGDMKKNDLGRHRYLMRPQLLTVAQLALKRDFDDYAVVVLADVSSLSPHLAAKLAAFARAGGNLMVVNGLRSELSFYNEWRLNDQFVLPAILGSPVISDEHSERVVRIDTGTLRHQALAMFKERGDLSDTVVDCYISSSVRDELEGVEVAARLNNGDPFLVKHSFGKGSVTQSLVPFDRTAGSLVLRQSFLPLIHEITAYLARPIVANLNISPSRGAVIRLASPSLTKLSGHGLLADYRKTKAKNAFVTRVDPTISFDWKDGSPLHGLPRDHFSVNWQGSFVPEVSGHYKFHARADDRVSLRVGALAVESVSGWKSVEGEFKAGARYPLSASYEEKGGHASVEVQIEGPGIERVVLPQKLLIPVQGREDSWSEAVPTRIQAPGERTLFGKIRYDSQGLAMRTDSPLMQGIYRVAVPEAAARWLGHLSGEEGADFPLCVTENPDESVLVALSTDEKAVISRHSDIVRTESFEDLKRALRGKTFGRELWRIPAVALLILLLLECFLTRWIAVQRRTGEGAA